VSVGYAEPTCSNVKQVTIGRLFSARKGNDAAQVGVSAFLAFEQRRENAVVKDMNPVLQSTPLPALLRGASYSHAREHQCSKRTPPQHQGGENHSE
jgi:hypothetical protein